MNAHLPRRFSTQCKFIKLMQPSNLLEGYGIHSSSVTIIFELGQEFSDDLLRRDISKKINILL